MNIEPIAREHLVQVLALLSRWPGPGLSGLLGFDLTLSDLDRQTFGDPDCEPDLLLGAFAGGEMLGHVMGVRRPWKYGRAGTGFVKFLASNDTPASLALLAAVEERLAASGVNELVYGSASPWYLFPGVPEGDAVTRAALRAAGWREVSERISMLLEVNRQESDSAGASPVAAIPVLATLSDRDEVLAFIESEFPGSWSREVAPVFRRADARGFCCLLRECSTKALLGFAAVGTMNPGWFGPMGVREDLRGRGYGKLLVRQALVTARERGIERLLLQWINEKELFYRKVVRSAERIVFLKCVRGIGSGRT